MGDSRMIQLDLNQQDIEVLVDTLEGYLSNLRMEISATDLQDYREGLKSRKEILIKVLDELKETTAH
jgi:RNAse (barnase) inhibitor barstar